MLCWGYWSLGQPGISTNLQGIVAEPQVCGFISDRSVKEVACGGNHSVFLLEGGEVYTCGLNTKGQLGHEREGNKPEPAVRGVKLGGSLDSSQEPWWVVHEPLAVSEPRGAATLLLSEQWIARLSGNLQMPGGLA
ncbi:putative E3 ubiquitin-protein ligase HERC3 [Galemys pyrenaicus]|uniref:Putative E3 ubiquitin-protein ligase HERC3 n=1 Tax=Galemys pyrenaicus TaxID=202257 RepID=A0A8J6DKL4_GALPY|nr:putative E3 ubiquitin-protein ligase HERC3 [Galemys pyrenaicus]